MKLLRDSSGSVGEDRNSSEKRRPGPTVAGPFKSHFHRWRLIPDFGDFESPLSIFRGLKTSSASTNFLKSVTTAIQKEYTYLHFELLSPRVVTSYQSRGTELFDLSQLKTLCSRIFIPSPIIIIVSGIALYIFFTYLKIYSSSKFRISVGLIGMNLLFSFLLILNWRGLNSCFLSSDLTFNYLLSLKPILNLNFDYGRRL